MNLTNRPTTIKGLSEQRRLPRLGKIRLGVRKVSQKSGKEYPTETEYFVVPPEVAKVYGEKPTEIDVMIPVEDTNTSFPQAFEMYGSGKGLKCVGDGETAFRHDEKAQDMTEVDCPCDCLETGACKQRAHLRVILPKVNVGGVYQIDTSSYNSIIDINSSIDYIRALVGRIALVPLKLKRVATETHHDGKKQTHYTMKLELEADIQFINTLRENTSRILTFSQYSLPAPVLENPVLDEGATVVNIDENTGEVGDVPAVTPTPPSIPVKQDKETKDYIKNVLFLKLKEMGLNTKDKALSKLQKHYKDMTFETLNMSQAENLFVNLQEEQDLQRQVGAMDLGEPTAKEVEKAANSI